MSNSYKYVDPGFSYIDPKSGILRNLAHITDEATLLFVESGAVTKRLHELYENPLKIEGIKSLVDIHKHLFQDIYDWAGKEPIVEISKDGKQFFLINQFHTAYQYIDSLIFEFKEFDKHDLLLLSQKLAEILDNINYLHPFRVGNGRAQREFLRLLALEKGLTLNLNPADNSSVYENYMTGTINSEINRLTNLIFELLNQTNSEA